MNPTRHRREVMAVNEEITKRLDRIESLAHALVSMVDELREYVRRQDALAASRPKVRKALDLKGRDKENEEPS